MSDSTVYLTSFDYIILAIIATSSIFGFVKGFIKGLLSLCSWVLIIFLISIFYENVAVLLEKYISNQVIIKPISIIGLYIILSIIMSFISNKVTKLLVFIQGGIIDRSLGFGLGFLKGSFASCAIFWILAILIITFSEKESHSWLLHSKSSQLLYQGTGVILKSAISPHNEYLNNFLHVNKFKIDGNVQNDLFLEESVN